MKLAFFFFIFIEVGVWKLEGSHVHHVMIVMGMVKTEQLSCHFHLLVYLSLSSPQSKLSWEFHGPEPADPTWGEEDG